VRDTLLRDVTADWADTPVDAPEIPRFRIERELGRGGMGTVYLGARDDGAFEQRVAIKVLRRGVDTDDVLARFRRERQILASFDHPHIARLLDGGATGDGRPFLVMEYVDGEPFTAWCATHRLDLPARLALFTRICDAVEYAHQRLVVHRDLKPSNILVDSGGTPKLLDFGIAKLLDEAPTGDSPADDSPVTRTGHVYATPRYASPEQLRGEPVTTATDVYQLGLLLYELLAGVHPMADVEPSLEAMRRALHEGALRTPSEVTGERTLRGDLDAIVLKALRDDASARYPSVAQLRDDLERHRRGLPVSARVGVRWYRLRRAAWRHRVALLVTGLALMAGTAYTLSLRSYSVRLETERNRAQRQAGIAEAERARADLALADATRRRQEADSARRVAARLGDEADAERARAERERDAARRAQQLASVNAERAQQTATFLVDLFRVPGDPTQVRGDTITARTLLERGAERVRSELGAQPAVLAPLLSAIGTASSRLGLPGYGALFDDEIAALARAYGPDDRRIADALRRQGDVYTAERDFSSASQRYGSAIRLMRRTGAPDSSVTRSLLNLSNTLTLGERVDSAELVLREALALRDRARDGASSRNVTGDQVADLQNRLAGIYRRQQRTSEADSLLRAALREVRSDSLRSTTLNNLGSLLSSQQRYAEAEPHQREALAIARRIFAPTDRTRNVVANNYAGALARQGKADAALAVLREEVDTHRAHFPADHWRVGLTEGAVAIQLRTMGRHAESAEWRARQVAAYRTGLGDGHLWTLNATLDLAETLQALDRPADAARQLDEVAARAPALENEADRRAVLARLGRLREAAGTPGRP
jgi:serine/threonine-protein kinase